MYPSKNLCSVFFEYICVGTRSTCKIWQKNLQSTKVVVGFYDPKACDSRQLTANSLNQNWDSKTQKLRPSLRRSRTKNERCTLRVGQKLRFYWSISLRGHDEFWKNGTFWGWTEKILEDVTLLGGSSQLLSGWEPQLIIHFGRLEGGQPDTLGTC